MPRCEHTNGPSWSIGWVPELGREAPIHEDGTLCDHIPDDQFIVGNVTINYGNYGMRIRSQPDDNIFTSCPPPSRSTRKGVLAIHGSQNVTGEPSSADPLTVSRRRPPIITSHMTGTPINDSFPRRNITSYATLGSISGTFEFREEVNLTTVAGSINAVLDPHPGDGPVIVRMRTQAGSIEVTVSDKYLEYLKKTKSMPRPWIVQIETSAGSVSTQLPIVPGSEQSITSKAGSVSSTVYAWDTKADAPVSKLTTITSAGNQDVEIKSLQDGVPISNLCAVHESRGSGDLRLKYSKEWLGSVRVSSGPFSNVKVIGDNLQQTQVGTEVRRYQRGDTEGQQVEVRHSGIGKTKFTC